MKWPKNFDPSLASYQDMGLTDVFWNNQQRKQNKSSLFYSTIQQASQAAQALGIKTGLEYAQRYHLDPRLHSNPNHFYGAEAWQEIGRMPGFLGQPKRVGKYETYEQASQAAQKLGIVSQPEYMDRFGEDPRLPARPDRQYPLQWRARGRWLGFLGRL